MEHAVPKLVTGKIIDERVVSHLNDVRFPRSWEGGGRSARANMLHDSQPLWHDYEYHSTVETAR